jgi:UDP-N-acetylglucosamine--N-acetylmuramyl-(pentapeptide) pyrophosphoryl-undecaprenol N-acetylglucosamine transferase
MARVLIAGGGTGGHLMPALALADALREADASLEPVLVGAARGIDSDILPRRAYRHYLLPVEPIYRRTWWRNLRWPAVAWRVWRQCGDVLARERPALAVGTGGYAAGPILFRAHREGIPLALQEQNAYPGLTTRWLARHARQVHLGFPEAEAHLQIGSTTAVHTLGNPIAPPPEHPPDRDQARAELRVPPGVPVVLVMGGSQGARSINRALAGILETGQWASLTLLWSTGHRSWDEYAGFDAPPGCQVRPFWDPIAQAYAAADLVVARAGAMSTAELCAWSLPSILIPLPTATADHQTGNATALAAAGAAVHLDERNLSAKVLREHVEDLLGAPAKLASMARAAQLRGRPKAAREIVRQLRSLLS